MAEISINGGKKVSTLKREFKAEYGLTLDVKKEEVITQLIHVKPFLK